MEKTYRSKDKVQHRLFLAREYQAIRGRGGFVFWMLYIIMLVALAAVAIGRTGLEHLQARMDDPFTTWVDIPASNTTVGDSYDALRSYLQDCAHEGRFHARNGSGSYSISVEGLVAGEGYWEYLRLQSFGFHSDSALLWSVLGDANMIADLTGRDAWRRPGTFRDGIIITENAIKQLGYRIEELRDRKIFLRNSTHYFPVRVVAVVQAVPGRRDVFVEHNLLRGIEDAYEQLSLTATMDTTHILLDCEDEPEARSAASKIGELFQVSPDSVDVVPDVSTLTHAWRVRCRNCGIASLRERSGVQERLTNDPGLRDLAPVILHETHYKSPDPSDDHGGEGNDRFDNLTITFSDLDSIGSFQRDLVKRFKVELDLDRVRSMENFAIISGLSLFLIVALVLFSALSILVFLYNLLQNHLERIKMNLGTFMAFGLPESFLYKGYLRIIRKLLFRAMLASMVTLALLEGLVWMLVKADVKMPDLLAGLTVVGNPWLYGTLAFLLIAGFLIFRWQLRRFLNNTPGDLIYGRR